jgi:hypothetical protein
MDRDKEQEKEQEKEKDKEQDKDKEKKPAWKPPEHLIEIWPHFEEHRKKLRKPMTDFARKGILDDLSKLTGDPKKQVSIIAQSIKGGWQGVFPLKEAQNQDSKTPNRIDLAAESTARYVEAMQNGRA